ncbi:uncharacterized protein ASCRUDRAFT_35342, partial [Ascoidea rubescens DSM 1968]
FCKALYDYSSSDSTIELSFKKDDLLAILDNTDHINNNNWLKCRSKSGQIGYIPKNYIKLINLD